MTAQSGTPLWEKIGIQEGHRVAAIGMPKQVAKLLKGVPHHEHVEDDADIVWWFVPDVSTFEHGLEETRARMRPGGMLWVSWPKHTSPLWKDLRGATVREAAMVDGLTDVKVCLIDDDWSGIKFVVHDETA